MTLRTCSPSSIRKPSRPASWSFFQVIEQENAECRPAAFRYHEASQLFRRQNSCISRNRNEADQVMRMKPVTDSVPAMNRTGPIGVRSPKPSVENVVADRYTASNKPAWCAPLMEPALGY